MPESNKHILIIVQNLPVPFDRRVWLEATTLKNAGFDVSVICPKKKIYTKGYEHLEGIDIYRYSLIFEASNAAVGYLVEFLYCWLATLFLSVKIYLKKPFRVIHACNPPDTFFALALLFRLVRVKFVFDHHDLSPEMFVAKGGNKGGFLHRALLLLERWTFETADLVIAVNESHKEIAIQRGHVGSDRIVVVRSGPRSTWGTGASAVPTLKDGWDYLVVYLGEMCAQDGVDNLLHAIAQYKQAYARDTLFVFVGGGPEQQRLAHLASDLQIDDVVRFTGRIPDEELWKYLATADICVDPDPLSEWSNLSTMNKIIEYMAFGRPIVAFDLLENRRSGLDAISYVAPNDNLAMADAIRGLLTDQPRRTLMSQFGRERFLNTLCWENSAEKLVKSYTLLLP